MRLENSIKLLNKVKVAIAHQISESPVVIPNRTIWHACINIISPGQ